MNLHDLRLRIRALIAPRRVERELDEELAFHIECETQKNIETGLSPAEARTRARARFGSVALAADQCRDARGTGFLDALVRDVLYAFRAFNRGPLAALTIIATVGLGLGLVTVVFTFYTAMFLHADAVRDPGELFVVERPPHPNAGRVWIPFTQSEYEALRLETDVFADVLGMREGLLVRMAGRPAGVTLVTGNFFVALGVRPSLGRALTPADDERGPGRRVIVLSDRAWRSVFGRDPEVIGRTVALNGTPYEIVGVMPAEFRGLRATPPDLWAPVALAGDLLPSRFRDEDVTLPRVIGRLKPGISRDTASAGLAVWAAARTDLETMKGHPAYVRLRSIREMPPDLLDGLLAFAPIFFAFGLILMIGCANVANLLLARGVARQREIGIRLSLGASRRRIIRQLLTESLLLALLSAACGLAISRVFLETANRLLVSTAPPEYAALATALPTVPAVDWRIAAFLVVGAVVSTVFFGLVPAIQATRLEIVRTMRGEMTRDARPARTRHALIAVQVGASALLLICAGVFLRSALAAKRDPGVRTSDTVVVRIEDEARRAAILQEVTAHPAVAAVAASSPGPMGFLEPAAAETLTSPGFPDTSRQAVVAYQFVSPEYFDVLDIELLRGRGFTQGERTPEAGVVVVSERVARELWPTRDALGRPVRLELDSPTRPGAAQMPSGPRVYAVVGVARDVGMQIRPFGMEFASPDVYLPIGATSPETSLTLRVHGDPDDARQALLQHLTKVDPALGAIRTLRTMAGMEAYVMGVAFWVTLFLGSLALVLTMSGLFSVLSYVVARRTREIGVRMALGATGRDVVRLVLAQSLRPVGIGLLAGAGLAAAVATVLMSTPAASQVGELVRVFDPFAYDAGPVVIVTASVLAASIPARRAARIDPITTLRHE